MKKVLLLLSLLSSHLLHAQTETNNKEALHVKFGIGVLDYSLTSFNELAAANNFYTLPEGIAPYLNLGIILNEYKHPFFVDMNFGIALFRNKKTSAYNMKFQAANFDLNLNYRLLNKSKFEIIPAFGLGFMSYSLDYTEKSTGTFAQLLQSNQTSIRTQTPLIFFANPRLAFEYKLGASSSLGLQIGYRLGINQPKWKVNPNQKLDGAPSAQGSGFYGAVYIKF